MAKYRVYLGTSVSITATVEDASGKDVAPEKVAG